MAVFRGVGIGELGDGLSVDPETCHALRRTVLICSACIHWGTFRSVRRLYVTTLWVRPPSAIGRLCKTELNSQAPSSAA